MRKIQLFFQKSAGEIEHVFAADLLRLADNWFMAGEISRHSERTTQFTYGQGNRLLEAVRTDMASGQVVSDKTADYDLNGNMTRWGDANYTWTTDGELKSVAGGAAPGGTYTYDALGRRKGQYGETIPSVWDGWSEAEPFDRDLVANKIYDPLGSLIQGVDWLGNTPVARLAYSPFGEATRTDDGSLDGSGTDKAQWAGMYNDRPTTREKRHGKQRTCSLKRVRYSPKWKRGTLHRNAGRLI